MRIIQLNRIVTDRSRDYADESEVVALEDANASDDPTERRAHPQVVLPPPIVTSLTAINVDAIRCFYPRKDSRPGTRITFKDGGGFAVTEPFADVMGLVNPS
jgi:hypothetical protein